jgi:hypothetical protein
MSNVDESLRGIFRSIAEVANQEVSRVPDYANLDYTQLSITFIFAFGVLIGAWILFEYLAQNETTKFMFRQRLFHPRCVSMTKNGLDHRLPPPDTKSMRSVLLGAFGIPSSNLLGLMGPGAHLSYRLMRHCTVFAHLALVYSMLVLVPLYASQFYRDGRDLDILGMLSVSYISPSNPSHMWVLVISSYIMCGYWVMVIYSEWQNVKAARLSWEHDSRSMHLQSHYSLLIEQSRGDRKLDLRQYLSRLLSKDESEVVVLTTAYDTVRLNNLKYRRFWAEKLPLGCFAHNMSKEETLAKYDEAIVIEQLRIKDLVSQPANAQKAKTLTRYQLGGLENALALERPEKGIGMTALKTTSNIVQTIRRLFVTTRLPTNFVTLKTMTSRTVLSHMYRAQGNDAFARLTPAPPPGDIVWNNLTVERKVITTRKMFVRILLFIFGTAYAYSLVKLQVLARVRDSEAASSLKTQFWSREWWMELVYLYLPASIQVLLTQLLPRFFRLVSLKYERYKTYQDVSRFVLHRAFLFQLLTIYVIVFHEVWIDTSGLSNGFVYFLDQVVLRFRRLGEDIPWVALYFASTVIINLVTETAAEMISPGQLILVSWQRYVGQNLDAWRSCNMIQFRYSSSMTSFLTILNIMFTFSLIQPVVVLFCWIFLGVSYVWNTYAFIYLNNRRYEVGSSFSPTIYNGISASLIFSQIALFFVMWSSDSTKWNQHLTPHLYCYSALIFLLLLFKYVIMKNFRIHANEFTSLALSSEIDRQHSPDEVCQLFKQEYYYQPEARDEVEEQISTTAQPQSALREPDDEGAFDIYSDAEETSKLINKDAQ